MALKYLMTSLVFLGLLLTVAFSNKASNPADITSDVSLINIEGKKLLTNNYKGMGRDIVDQIIQAFKATKASAPGYPIHAFFPL
jgi:hypothetical protein